MQTWQSPFKGDEIKIIILLLQSSSMHHDLLFSPSKYTPLNHHPFDMNG